MSHKIVETEKKSKKHPELTPALKEKSKKFLSEYAKKEVMALRRKAKKEGKDQTPGSNPNGGDISAGGSTDAIDESFELEEDNTTVNDTSNMELFDSESEDSDTEDQGASKQGADPMAVDQQFGDLDSLTGNLEFNGSTLEPKWS